MTGPKWHRLRRKALDAVNWRCQADGCDRLAEEVHHIRPLHLGGHGLDEPENLLPLCRGHHRAIHDRLAGQPRAIEWRDEVRRRLAGA